jgi:hypothetical protein
MDAPIHYATPALEPHTAMLLAVVALWGWPLLITGIVAVFRWAKLRSPIGFLILGYLSCVGISALAPRIGGYLLFVHIMPTTPRDQIVVTAVNESIRATVAGIALSVIPVIWLAKLLERPTDAVTSNRSSSEPT